MVSDAPGDIELVQGTEVVVQRGILSRHTQLSGSAVDVVQQRVHVGELHRGVEELLVTALQGDTGAPSGSGWSVLPPSSPPRGSMVPVGSPRSLEAVRIPVLPIC